MKVELSDDLDAMWPAYRLVMEGKVSLGELEHLSILDVECANDALDAWLDAQRRLGDAP